MCGQNTTNNSRSAFRLAISSAAALALTGLFTVPAAAQIEGLLEEIIVTATKRDESIQDVPISIASLSRDRLESKFSGGESILALASSVPGLYAESSNGRAAPRFYMRGLGNADFDQSASQPVSVVIDEVPMELVVLKSFPLFDLDDIEVIRGPQGTLFGRNTTAGIVKIDSRRPTDELTGYAKVTAGNLDTFNFEAAVGGPLIEDVLLARVSVLSQNRGNWISNSFTGEGDVIGKHQEKAGRVQLLWTPADNFSALLMVQGRNLDGNAASVFRANVLTQGDNELNSNFDRDSVFYDGGGNNPQTIKGDGATLTLDWDIGDLTLTSITSKQDYEYSARGDIDGGVAGVGPGFILFSSDTGGTHEIDQLTQELRLASNNDAGFNWQVGAFFFEDELLTQPGFGVSPTTVVTGAIALHENTTWAVFGQGTFDIGDSWTLTAGARYTDDEKDYWPVLAPPTQAAIHLADDNTSWDISLSYALNETSRLYGRVAAGFRAPSIQSRNAAFGAPVTTADSETIASYEVGYKAELSDRARINAAVFHYVVDDMQLTAIGGGGNFTTLLNADEGIGTGFEIDLEFAATENLILTGGFGYNDTEIDDPTLSVGGCNTTSATFERICTITDPLNALGAPIIDGNKFQHIPEWTLNLELDYTRPLSGGAEVFFFTDWKFKGDSSAVLYESVEFENDSQFEGGLRTGWRNADGNFELAAFGRNITDEENLIGAIDFVNLTGYVNEPRVYGVEATLRF
ncbi:MAG: TonB-dependent receptor [Woeseiaceae bacterium]